MLRTNNEKDDNDPLLKYYTLPKHSTTAEATFGITRLYNTLSIMASKDLQYWNEIIANLFVGTILSKEMAEEFFKTFENIGLVFSTVEAFELSGNVGITKISILSPADLKKKNIKHHLLIIPDFTADVDVRILYKALEAIHETRMQGKGVYLHCKAGVGRSALTAVCYLARYRPKGTGLTRESTTQDIIRILKGERSQINLKTEQIKKLEEFIAYVKSMEDIPQPPPKIYSNIHEYLSSYEAKEKICQLAYYKELYMYASEKQNSKRALQIEEFMTSIYYAKDSAIWLLQLLSDEGPLQKLLDARPYNGVFKTGAPHNRTIIVEGLKKDLAELIRDTFKFTPEKYDEVIKKELHDFKQKKLNNSFLTIS